MESGENRERSAPQHISFQSDPDADKNFLESHTDTHSLLTLFFSISDGESWVYYTEKGVVVAKLSLPAGLNVIVTTEIHSGLKAFNPNGVKHFSQSVEDRLLFRIVQKAPPGGLHMDRSNPEWTQFLGDALSAIWPLDK